MFYLYTFFRGVSAMNLSFLSALSRRQLTVLIASAAAVVVTVAVSAAIVITAPKKRSLCPALRFRVVGGSILRQKRQFLLGGCPCCDRPR